MTTHELKTWPEYFEEVMRGNKTFEVRRNDRDFKIGDLLLLKEWVAENQEFTGRYKFCVVNYILPGGKFGIGKDYVVMSIERVHFERGIRK